jgi:hypothetical protein
MGLLSEAVRCKVNDEAICPAASCFPMSMLVSGSGCSLFYLVLGIKRPQRKYDCSLHWFSQLRIGGAWIPLSCKSSWFLYLERVKMEVHVRSWVRSKYGWFSTKTKWLVIAVMTGTEHRDTMYGQTTEVAKRWAHCVGRGLKLQGGRHTVWAEGWRCKELGTLCGQRAEVAKRWAHCVGRRLKLQRGGHTVWAEGWSCKEVGTLCGQRAEVAKRWAYCVGRMLKLQRDRHTVWAECWSYKETGTPCGQNAEVTKR